MAAVEKRPVTLGGKGSSLSSADVFHVANDVARVTVDSSAVKRRSSSSNSASKYTFSVPNFFTTEETRASILLLVNKLLLSSSPSAAAQFCGILERNALKTSDYNVNDVTSDDLSVIDFAAAAVDGVSAVIDHCCAGLSAIADAVAAISCEVLRVDVSPFNLTDSGDGSCSKDAVAVAADFKVFFNGSKFVSSGKKLVDCCVAEIPLVHGDFREYTRLLHSRTRVRLSSGFSAGSAHYMSTALLSLAASLSKLGELSIRRAHLIVENSISDKDLSDSLSKLFDDQCSQADSLKELYLSSQAALMKEDYLLFMHKIYELLDAVRKIVSREAVTAFVALEGSQMFVEKIAGDNGSMSEPLSGDITEVDKKGNKKKKVVLGKGTIALMQFIKDKLLNGATTSLEKCALDLLALLDPRGLGFDDLLKKVKDIVESNESGRLPKVAKGTRDYAKEMVIRERAFSIITNVFKRHGAMALDTPVFELRETLMGKYGEDSKLIYHLADQGGELCSLRYDLTVPFARYVAMNGLTSFKRYQIAKVYRRDNPSKGRYREFYQCDFDIAGQSEKMGPDFEVIAILTELLNELHIGDYEVKLNHRKLLDGMLALCGVPQVKFRTICSSIDKLDKQTFEEIKKEMVEVKGLTEETADKIGTFVKHRGSPMELLSELLQEGSEFLSNSDSKEALNELEILFKVLEKAKCIDRVVFDLSLARGLDYYTGVIFEAVLKGGDTKVGSIAAGGRYDNLIGMFGSKQVPAVGISLGIERVFEIMKQQETRAIETQVLVSILGNDRKSGNDLQLAGEFVGELSRADIKTEYMINSDVKKQIRRAVDSQIPYMVLVGKQELDEGIVKLKDIKARTEDKVPRNQLVEKLLELLPRLCDACSKKSIPGLRS